MANVEVTYTHGKDDTDDEWERLRPLREPLQPPPQEVLSAIYNYIKDRPNRDADQDVLTLLAYSQGEPHLLEKAIRDNGQEQTDIEYVYLDALINFQTYLSVNPNNDFSPIKGYYVLPSTHKRLYELNATLRFSVLAAFTPDTNEQHHNQSNTALNYLIDKAMKLTKIPTRTSTFVKDKLNNLPEPLDTTYISHSPTANNNQISHPPYRYEVPDDILSDLKKINPRTAHLLLQITNQGDDMEEALAHLQQMARTAFYQTRENTRAPAPQRITEAMTTDQSIFKINKIINRMETASSSSTTERLPKWSMCRMDRQQHHNNCMNCRNTSTVPYNTTPVIEYYLPDGGYWYLDFADDIVQHKYIDHKGNELNPEETAQLISLYLVPINDKFFTPPLPANTPLEMMSASDSPELL
ncbi:unnamed protein product [Polarella glacialis]|uniref:Uncharacterized protein n=1 Tax=Polarella glacialis TaxID=89957 RepID=A0A813DI24_POLGL|nr:unnamed protein product [Polarella glacialis]